MKRMTLILGVVAVMVAMIVAFAAPAIAKDNDGNGKNNGNNSQHNNNGNNHDDNNGGIGHLDNRLDRIDNRVDNQLDRIDNRVDNWFDNDRDVNIRYVSDGDDFDGYYPYYWGYYPYWGYYGDCGFDWDGPVTPADCWD